MRIDALKILTGHPADTRELEHCFDSGRIDPARVVCIIGKTEGNGGRNDFTRDLAMLAFEELFSKRLSIERSAVTERIIFSLSGGCEGVVSPHIVVFSRIDDDDSTPPAGKKRLALGIGFTREFEPGEIGRMPQVEETARVVSSIMSEIGIDSGADLHLVQMKGAIPSYSYEEGEAARRAGKPMRSDMVYSRGASALGVAVASGEVELAKLSDDAICSRWEFYSSVASCSAKPGLPRTEIMVLGMSSAWGGDLVIESGVLEDMIDIDSIRAVLARLGMNSPGQCSVNDTSRLIGIFAKSEADPRGTIHGKRHTMLTDDDISDTRYSRCVLSSVIAGVTGDTAVYVSTRSEHHGPLGGGTLAIIARA